MLLADAAQAVDNKLYVLGGGWSVTNPTTAPFGLAIKIEVPWSEALQKHMWSLELMDADGHAVMGQSADGSEEPIQIGGDFEVGRPEGLPPGTPIDFSLAINSTPLTLAAGSRYMWRLFIDGQTSDDWYVAFMTRIL